MKKTKLGQALIEALREAIAIEQAKPGRMPLKSGRVFKDKTKYDRKKKHRKKDEL